ncbi:uncharacterized protein LOC108159205 isoform X1 [Drosophila miranda]|uniref:uncharacterized protein LOC108159205 isoform X1 n=1 Tax=Drosophila miranda TaxID=7229 RepID=UPI00143F2DFA|nr:uncharacterized protein LOC108159205 isoform X1 [Drosophila miranda]
MLKYGYVWQLVVVVVLLQVEGLRGQCADCSQHWGYPCKANVTGYYCAPGSAIDTVPLVQADYETSTIDPLDTYSQCTPYPFALNKIGSYCCVYSPKIGCQAAINTHMYKYESNPVSYCKRCIDRCLCDMGDTGHHRARPWTWPALLVGVLAITTVGLHMRPEFS